MTESQITFLPFLSLKKNKILALKCVLYYTGVLFVGYIIVICGLFQHYSVTTKNTSFPRSFNLSALRLNIPIRKFFMKTSASWISKSTPPSYSVNESEILSQDYFTPIELPPVAQEPNNPISKSLASRLASTLVESFQSLTSPLPAESRHFLCTGRMGRLGNHLFEFASGYGIAAKKNMVSIIQQQKSIDLIFELKNDSHLLLLPDLNKCNKVPKRYERWCSRHDPRLENFTVTSDLWIGWGLQSWKYFNDSYENLRKQLTFKKPIRDKVITIQEGIFRKYNFSSRHKVTFIGVHIRRGDMLTDPLGYDVATPEYLSRAVAFFKNYTNTIFIVCSTDLKWSKENMPKNIRVEYIVGNSAEVDMALLAYSDHVIQTVGTFGWWSGFLNNGTVIYYKWPAKEGKRLRSTFSKDYSDFFMPHWIGM